jgi:hypothetical protein
VTSLFTTTSPEPTILTFNKVFACIVISPEPVTLAVASDAFSCMASISPEPVTEASNSSAFPLRLISPEPEIAALIVVGYFNVFQDVFFCFERNAPFASYHEANVHAAVNADSII